MINSRSYLPARIFEIWIGIFGLLLLPTVPLVGIFLILFAWALIHAGVTIRLGEYAEMLMFYGAVIGIGLAIWL